jgi:hypothetical protein
VPWDGRTHVLSRSPVSTGIKSVAAATAPIGCINGIVLFRPLQTGTPRKSSLPISPPLRLRLEHDRQVSIRPSTPAARCLFLRPLTTAARLEAKERQTPPGAPRGVAPLSHQPANVPNVPAAPLIRANGHRSSSARHPRVDRLWLNPRHGQCHIRWTQAVMPAAAARGG